MQRQRQWWYVNDDDGCSSAVNWKQGQRVVVDQLLVFRRIMHGAGGRLQSIMMRPTAESG